MKRTAWSMLLDGHMQRQRITQADLAKNIGVSQASVSDYLIGDLRPPLQHISTIADCLSLIGQERVSFIEEAYLTHAPDRVRSLVADLRRRISRLEAMCTKHGLDVVGP
jgi:transcriptional regulator with XRE-family HTH domain